MIPFVRQAEVDYGVCEQLSPLIRRVTAANPGPFTYTGTGTYIVGGGDVAVIDPGPALPDHLNALMRALEGERISVILTTHTHNDHSPLARPLAEATGALVIGLPAPEFARGEDGPAMDEAQQSDFRPDRTPADGERFTGPSWTLRAIHTPGHASNHVCYALEEEHSLFSGDHVMGWSTTVISPPDGDMGDYYRSLDKVAAEDFRTLWPTHGPPVTDPAPFLAAYKAHRLTRERRILETVDAGVGRIPDMVRAIYTDVDPRLHPAAAHSVLAHLIHLARDGAVVAEGEGVAARWRLAAGV